MRGERPEDYLMGLIVVVVLWVCITVFCKILRLTKREKSNED